MSDFLKVLTKVLPPIVSIITTIVVAIGGMNEDSGANDSHIQDSAEWMGL